MKVEAILKKPVNPPIEKVVIELTLAEAQGLLKRLAGVVMNSSDPEWRLWFDLRAALRIDAQPGFEVP